MLLSLPVPFYSSRRYPGLHTSVRSLNREISNTLIKENNTNQWECRPLNSMLQWYTLDYPHNQRCVCVLQLQTESSWTVYRQIDPKLRQSKNRNIFEEVIGPCASNGAVVRILTSSSLKVSSISLSSWAPLKILNGEQMIPYNEGSFVLPKLFR